MVRSAIFSLMLCLIASACLADQVTLKNGDRLTGSIVKYDQEKLFMKSELAGDITFFWSAVSGIVSTKPLHIFEERADHRRPGYHARRYI